MELKKEIIILSGKLEAEFKQDPEYPDSKGIQAGMIILRNLFIQAGKSMKFPWYSPFRAKRVIRTFKFMNEKYESFDCPNDKQHMPDRRIFSKEMAELLRKFVYEM